MNVSNLMRAVMCPGLLAALVVPAAGQAVDGRALLLDESGPAAIEAAEHRGAVALGLALRRVGPTGRVLMIGAHPDDEDTQLLAQLALAGGADVAYLSLTRGEGGQNAIGPDFQEALGIIRTEELLAARRMDGARQFFGRMYDYGFSKSADEAFRHWPRDTVLADVVRIIRRFRPDAVVSIFTGTPRDGHGQHQAAGIIAREAFTAAADPTRFPEQLRAGLVPWRTRKLYEGGYFRQDSLTTLYPTGAVDRLLGRSHAVVATISRGRHRSQSLGRLLPLGPRNTGVNLVEDLDDPAVTRPERSIFRGMDTTLTARAAAALGGGAPATRLLAEYDSLATAARTAFNPLQPDAVVPLLSRAARLLGSADSALAGEPSLQWYVQRELEDARAALLLAQGLVVDATSPVEQVARGSTLEVTRSVWNGGLRPVTWHVGDSALVVAPGELASRPVSVEAPDVASEPYYLRLPRSGDFYPGSAGAGVDGLPFEPPLSAAFSLELDGTALPLRREITFRAVDAIDGETRRPVRVVPAVTVRLDRAVAVRPRNTTEPLALAVRVAEEVGNAAAGELRLVAPAGWSVSPGAVPLQLAAGEVRNVRFTVTLPPDLDAGSHELAALFVDSVGREYRRGFQLIDYPHIQPHPLYADARMRVEVVDLAVPAALRDRPVGYIMGAGDEVPAALTQLGIDVEPITLESPASNGADFSRYAAIVVGVRAYDTRPELARANRRLLEWVRTGGTLLVQYQQHGWAAAGLAPYPIEFAQRADRVTDENARVTVLEPSAAVLQRPNRMRESDWEGWVQERGLWFPSSWDGRWRPLLEMGDPGEPPQRGALLMASHGEGTVIYTGLSFFRQLPAGVPGAYRLLVNLLAGPQPTP